MCVLYAGLQLKKKGLRLRWISGLQARVNGVLAERKALAYLRTHGLTLVEKNFTCKSGEIDLIMREAESFVFVEVKSRQSNAFGTSLEFVHNNKRSKIKKAIATYFAKKNINPAMISYRIDVVGLDEGKVTWIKSI